MWKMVGEEGDKKMIGYKFYKKGVSSNWVTPYRSAQGMNGKVASLSQDVFRLLSNSNWAVSQAEKVELIDRFCGRLEMSGYPVEVAARIVWNGITNYERKVEKATELGLMFHRKEDQGRLERRRSKITGGSGWFRHQEKSTSQSDAGEVPTRWKPSSDRGMRGTRTRIDESKNKVVVST